LNQPSLRTPADDPRLDSLSGLAHQVLADCARAGASAAEVAINDDRGLAVNVRLGEVETIERTRDRGVGITVYFGQRKGAASSADLRATSLSATVEKACAIARHTEPDPAAGLADPDRMATRQPDFDRWHPWDLDPERAIAIAGECERAGLDADPRIGNSEGAGVDTGESLAVYANSHGFLGTARSTHHSISCSLIAGRGEGMQRDHWYSFALAGEWLEGAASVGRHAARRAVERLDPRPAPTGEFPVLFVPEMARSLVGHLLAAVSGGALYRRASFLLDQAGQRLFPDWFSLVEHPHRQRGLRSSAFDGEGVATRESALVRAGVLERYLLGSYSARKLGLESTGNAGGVHNLDAGANAEGLDELLAGMGRGLLVTELMGQGVNTVTGDYSRGAAGFWVEAGRISHPVDELTIAGNLRGMFAAIEAVGADVDPRSHIGIGSVLVGRMTVAGGG
jgi:PmbA protein